MDITEINIIGDFEAGIKCLQNPSLFSGFSPLSKVPQLYSFWKWGALIIAIYATFTSVINRLKLLIYRIRRKSFVSSVQNHSQQIYDDDDYDFDYSDDDDCSSASEESDDEDDFESEDDRKPVDEVFRVAGSSCFWEDRCQNGNKGNLRLRNRLSWSDFSAGKSVVQLWDSFGLGLDFEEDSYGSEISVWDLDGDVKLSSGWSFQVPAGNLSSSAVILSAEMNDNDEIVLSYDTRVGSKKPAIYAAWTPRVDGVIGEDELSL